MDNINKIMELWYFKIPFAALLTVFAPVKMIVIIVFVMIFLDTLTGTASAIKMKRFNSRAFSKNFKKLIIYATCLFTVRLLEVGAFSFLNTIAITQFVAGFLIITEGLSVLENLAILGLPISANFINIMFKQIRAGISDKSLYMNNIDELKEIEDILYFQIPSIKSDDLRKLLKISFKQYLSIGSQIIIYFNNINKVDNDLIYFKTLSIIQIGFEEIKNNFEEEKIPKQIINEFNLRIKPWLNEFFIEIRHICYSIVNPRIKKEEIIKKFIIFLYRIVIEAQKNEFNNSNI